MTVPGDGQVLGAGRHSVAANSSGAGAAFLVPTAEGARLGFAAYNAKGLLVRLQEDLASGGASDLWGGPMVAVADAGYVVAWTDRFLDGDELGVALRKLDGQGNPVGAAIVASSKGAFAQHHPDVIWTGTQWLVAWVDDTSVFTAPDLRLRAFAPDLSPAYDEVFLAATAASEASVALAAFAGSWAAAWRSATDGAEQVEVVTEGGQAWTFGPFFPAEADDRPALLELGSQRLVLAFSARTTPDEPSSVRLVILDASNGSASEPIAVQPVVAPSGMGLSHPALAKAGESVFLAWRTGAVSTLGAGEDLWVREFPILEDGHLSLEETEVPLPREPVHRPADQRLPSLAVAGPAGQLALVSAWEDRGGLGVPGSTGARIFVQFAPIPLTRTPGAFGPEGGFVACHDGIDNDDSGTTDCEDAACEFFCERTEATCGDGLDNDGDGKTDCNDLECAIQFVCPETFNKPETCSNGIDDDKDGKVDLADLGCYAQ